MWGWLKPILETFLAYFDSLSRQRGKAVNADPTAGGRRDRFRRAVLDKLRQSGRTNRP